MSTRDVVLLGKAEVTPGTDPVPAPGTDAIRLAEKPEFTTDYTALENKSVKQTYGDLPADIISKAMKLDVKFFLRSGGGLGIRPDFAPVIECGNHNVTLNAGVSVVIDPVTALVASRKTSSFYYYEDGLKWDFIGAMLAGLTIEAQMDGAVMASASILAPFKAPAEAALPGGLVYQSSDRIIVSPSDVVTDSAVAIKIGGYTFESSISTSEERLVGANEIHMDDRPKPMITFTKASLGTKADYDRIEAMTKGAFSSQFGAAGNRFNLTGPNCQFESIKGTVEGIRNRREIGLALYENSGDDAYQIVLD